MYNLLLNKNVKFVKMYIYKTGIWHLQHTRIQNDDPTNLKTLFIHAPDVDVAINHFFQKRRSCQIRLLGIAVGSENRYLTLKSNLKILHQGYQNQGGFLLPLTKMITAKTRD